MRSKLSGVFPLSISEKSEENSFELADILLTSLAKYSAYDLFDKLYIIAPSQQAGQIKSYMLKWSTLPIEVLDENKLIPEFISFPSVRGWLKQQLIKLAASKIVDTPFFITFDADIVCTHPISESILLPRGKALLQLESRRLHPFWWNSSARLLKVKPDLEKMGMSVTPAILSTEVCKGLIDELCQNGKSWIALLLSPHKIFAYQRLNPKFKVCYRWTEYTLYYLYMEKHNITNNYHAIVGEDDNSNTLISHNSVWTKIAFDKWDESLCFSEQDPGLFCVIQSNKNITPVEIWQRLSKYID